MTGPASTQLFFEDFIPGQCFDGQTRTMDEAAFRGFAALTGDAHPIHYDQAYAQRTRFGERVCHGLLLMAVTALGATPLSARLEDAMIAFVGVDGRFERAVLIGDTITTAFRVDDVSPSRTAGQGLVRFAVSAHNQRGEPVLTAHHTYLLRTRRS